MQKRYGVTDGWRYGVTDGWRLPVSSIKNSKFYSA
jgi:hypothetical protein